MDDFARRLKAMREADVERNALMDEMFQMLGDMQKTMDRNSFVLVLIDGDCMNFLDSLIKQGMNGGSEAATLIRQATFEYLRHDADFKHDYKIVTRVFANLRGLSRTYVENGTLPATTSLAEFVIGFNKAHPLSDFIDAGNQKEAADAKLKENLSLYIRNVHCKKIIFGASGDNGYASFLSSFNDIDAPSQVRLLKGPPFSFEFQGILTKFSWTEFTNVFRSEPIPNHGSHQHHPKCSTDFHGQVIPFNTVLKPTNADIVKALVAYTRDSLAKSPTHLDSGAVRALVEQALNLESGFWAISDRDEWMLRSKQVIKWTVEDWVERTNNSPPRSATWMLRYFTSGETPSAIMKSQSAQCWRTLKDPAYNVAPMQEHQPAQSPTDRMIEQKIYRNAAGMRIDIPAEINFDRFFLNELRKRKPLLCNAQYLLRGCPWANCGYDHTAQLSGSQFETLIHFARNRRCEEGSLCDNAKCFKGHICPQGKICPYGNKCHFADVHGIDTNIANCT